LEDGFPVPHWYSDDHRRPAAAISYDLVMADDMDFAEGSYRIDGGNWCVFIFSKGAKKEPHWKTSAWESGVYGIVAEVPIQMSLNMTTVEKLLSEVLGVGTWERVRGPDATSLTVRRGKPSCRNQDYGPS
jgi:hypothetical protein